jgi:hypothetical protein
MKEGSMKFLFAICFVIPVLLFAVTPESAIYESDEAFSPCGRLDEIVLKNLKEHNLTPAKRSSDATFLRRVYVDLIGTVPTFNEAKLFLADKSPDKRSKLIDSLLNREEFALYWSLKWCDILRVKSEFPINLWPNAVQAYHHWIWDSIEKNKPYDQFARELLTTSGSNFREPAVNFYRATQNRTPEGFAKVAVQAFLCSKFDKWPEYRRKEMEKLFSRIAIKGTDEWKEQIVYLDPAPAKAMSIEMPDGKTLNIQPDQDPRAVFADWLVDSGELWFAEAAVNRVWFWLFGRGIVQEPDDFIFKNGDAGFFERFFGHPRQINTGNPPVNPELLKYLAEEFKNSGYDFKALCRLITNSATYQQSPIPAGNSEMAEKYFAVYPVHRMDAEVLRDAFSYISGFRPKYMSVIPEPFTFIPRDMPTIALGDGSITSAFLEKFGRPARDTGYLTERNNITTYTQRLFLLNSPMIQNQIIRSPRFKEIVKKGKGVLRDIIDNIYLFILSRKASEMEVRKLMEIYQIKTVKSIMKDMHHKPGRKLTPKERAVLKRRRVQNNKKVRSAAADLVWTLVNTKEFLFKH